MLQEASCTETCCDAENSETQLGKDVKYKMLVCAIKQETGEEVAQLVSESFTVGPHQLGLVHAPSCMQGSQVLMATGHLTIAGPVQGLLGFECTYCMLGLHITL